MLGRIGAFLGLCTLPIALGFAVAHPELVGPRYVPGGVLLQLLPTLALAGVVWACSRQAMSLRTLVGLEVGLSLMVFAVIALLPYFGAVAGSEPASAIASVLCLAFLRALLVPSTAMRTLTVTAVGAIGVSAAIAPLVVAGGTSPALAVTTLATWTAIAVAISAVASDVIYGLRDRARRAHALGRHEIVRPIGVGAMGTVYLAKHEWLNRLSAVKVLPAESLDEPTALQFQQVVQRTSQLSHPNTVAIHDYGRTENGDLFCAMDYLPGRNLEQLVEEEGPLSTQRTIWLMSQLLSALMEAHELGIVHGDLKPTNVIVGDRGGITDLLQVTDFGLLESLRGRRPRRGDAVPHHLAPEQILGSRVIDHRADLYSVGALTYFLLAGAHVFDGCTFGELLFHQHSSQPPPLSSVAPQPIPHSLEAVVMACLRKNPDARPGSAREVRDRLQSALFSSSLRLTAPETPQAMANTEPAMSLHGDVDVLPGYSTGRPLSRAELDATPRILRRDG